MATSGEGSNPGGRAGPRPLAQLQELEPRVARRRLSQARHRATLAGLFNILRKTVYSQSDLTASKWQVLNKAKNHIQDLEHTLDNLLQLKGTHVRSTWTRKAGETRRRPDFAFCAFAFNSPTGSFNLEDGHANSLEEVKEEYASMYSRNHRYLNFYKHTMDLLIRNGIVSSQEVTLPIVSAAISHLWQNLSEDRKTSLLQAWAQEHSGLPGLPGACQETACTEGSMKDSGVDSQGASCSLMSSPEELLFEDAFDVASFLDKSDAPSTSSSSSVLASCNPENPEEKFRLYMQIIDFFKGFCCVNTQLKEEPDLPTDDEIIMLRCMETFDDEDL
ncbi:Stimulated by retinoic acid protein 8 protein like protein [Pteropus alecto]|uniref:Stimulated by retinoic acid protein 8 protein like protein n=1 Tax=Pteropus alecto TaxID=9402 RepID=L5KSA7_PTEAL|nr:Stimulated by retinoic acid protein 8 protein like protein [Pteropus alecto]